MQGTAEKKSQPYRPPSKAQSAAVDGAPTAHGATAAAPPAVTVGHAPSSVTAADSPQAPAATPSSAPPATASAEVRRFAAKSVRTIPLAKLWALRDTYNDPIEGFDFDQRMRAAKLESTSASLHHGTSTPMSSTTGNFPDVLLASTNAFKKRDASQIDAAERHLRALQSALNKLTPDNYDHLVPPLLIPALFEADVVTKVVERIYDKSLEEPLYAPQYALMCGALARYQFDNLSEGKTFRVGLVQKAQEMFEAPYNRRADGTLDASAASETEIERNDRIRKRKISNIKFTGQLYQKNLLVDKVIATILRQLLFNSKLGDDLDVEVAVCLLETVGHKLDDKTKSTMDQWYSKLKEHIDGKGLSNRVRFLAQNLLELRAKQWQRPQSASAEELIAEAKRVCGISDSKDATQWWPTVPPPLTDAMRSVIAQAFESSRSTFFATVALLDGSQAAPVNRMSSIAEVCTTTCMRSDEAARLDVAAMLKAVEHPLEIAHAVSWSLMSAVIDDVVSDCPQFYARLAAVCLGAAGSASGAQISMLRDVMSRACTAVDKRRENGEALEDVELGLLAFWPVAMKQLVAAASPTHGAVLAALAAVPSGPCWDVLMPDVLSGLTTSGCCTVPQLSTWRDNHASEPRYSTVIQGLSDLLAV